MYGTTGGGGGVNSGTVFEMMPSGSGWTEAEIFVFGGANGESPESGVIMDQSGNLYGTLLQGSGNQGEVYELSPNEPYWTENILVRFEEGINGNAPAAPLVSDQSGNLYGMTLSGAVFELSYSAGTWNYSQIYSLPEGGGYGLAIDAAGNLYGTQFVGGANGWGTVFKLTPSNGSWTYTGLHDFAMATGAYPYSSLTLDAQGNLYGTASQGGRQAHGCGFWGCGCVWKLTP